MVEWVPLEDIKKSKPIELDEYTINIIFKKSWGLIGGLDMYYVGGVALSPKSRHNIGDPPTIL